MSDRMDISERIAICTVEGDYINWDKDEPPRAGDCPFQCGCTPYVYVRAIPTRGAVRWYASEGDGVPWVVLQDEGGMVNAIAECDQQVHAENIARVLNARGAVDDE